jgi:hypothetical protein
VTFVWQPIEPLANSPHGSRPSRHAASLVFWLKTLNNKSGEDFSIWTKIHRPTLPSQFCRTRLADVLGVHAEAEPVDRDQCLSAGRDPKNAQHGADVNLGGVLGDSKLARDELVGETF